jgi:AAA15 family ATPase/GTPase
MGARIKSVHIENFRSIGILDVTISPFTVFVGKNDCGKSNVLRALNLFFNGETNHRISFDFDED